MPQFENYEVWIHVGGEKLPEYGVQHSSRAGRTEITCWIPSEVGKAFEIFYKDSIRAFATALRVSVDGNQCPGNLLDSRKTEPFLPDSLIQKGINVSLDSYRPFLFSNCQLTDDDESVSSSSDPGQITAEISQVAVGGYRNDLNNSTPFPEPKVYERSKKGLVHGTQLGPERLEKRTARDATEIQHLVTFKFNYRPLDKLQADGIAPLSTPSNEEEAIIQALKEELCTLEARQHQKKRQRSDSKTLSQHIKKERTIALDNNVIDLT